MFSLPAKRRWKLALSLLIVLALLVPLFSGCSKKNQNTSELSGKVLYKGSPMQGGTLFLHPQDAKAAAGAPPIALAIGRDGTFAATNMPIGKMKVTVQSITAPQGYDREAAEKMMEQMPNKPANMPQMPNMDTGMKAVEISPKYLNALETPLEWDITAGKNPPKEFNVD